MTPHKGETREQFIARRNEYDRSRYPRAEQRLQADQLIATEREDAEGNISRTRSLRAKPVDPLIGRYVVIPAQRYRGAASLGVIEAQIGSSYLVKIEYGETPEVIHKVGKDRFQVTVEIGRGFYRLVPLKSLEKATIFDSPQFAASACIEQQSAETAEMAKASLAHYFEDDTPLLSSEPVNPTSPTTPASVGLLANACGGASAGRLIG